MPFILEGTINRTFLERIKATPHLVGFQFKPAHSDLGPVNDWKQITYRQFFDECRLHSLGLMELGVRPDDRVAIISDSRYQWLLSDFAILGARAITVPIYPSSLGDEMAFILEQCEVETAFVENDAQLEKLLSKQDELKHLRKVIVLNPAMLAPAQDPTGPRKLEVLSMNGLRERGSRAESVNPNLFEENLIAAKPGDLFTITYTSGSSGIPKGVMLTHDNLMSVLNDSALVFKRVIRPDKEVTLTFLPFSHILGRLESMGGFVFGWKQCFAESHAKLLTNLREIQPTLLFTVPKTLELAHEHITERIESEFFAKRAVIEQCLHAAARVFEARREGKRPSMTDMAEYEIARRSVLKKISEQLGSKLRFAICGGAPLPKQLGEFFDILGIKILEGYGLTETCGPITLNLYKDPQYGTVGPPLPEVTLKTAEDGEILVKSRKVFRGYYKMPEETEAALRDGWLHTEDIGYLDSKGLLHITDRKKDILITSGGKNIAPQKIEAMAQSHKIISHLVVIGDGRSYPIALVTLNEDQIIQWATEHQVLFSEYSELVRNPKVQILVQRIIDEINTRLPSHEMIRKFVILRHDFSVETGELTPSLKVRRNVITQKYQELLNRIYASA